MNANSDDTLAFMQSDAVTPRTRSVLRQRLMHERVASPGVFSLSQFKTLQAVCKRLIPQPESDVYVDLPGLLDQKLLSWPGKGWRYESLPAGNEVFTLGMEGIEETAALAFGLSFAELEPGHMDKVLASLQAGNARGAIWQSLPAGRFFEELLAALVEIYYSHPSAKAIIGDASFADAHGWTRIGLNEPEDPAAANASSYPSIH